MMLATVPESERESFWVWLVRKLRTKNGAPTLTIINAHPRIAPRGVEDELRRLRDVGKVSCTNGKWWVR